ncbi:MAG: T9SS type A sorting domain-containing protein [Bacteroidetes bacterium]|nr:T9SS type A sorting domain-containing protein [Bacteroidota bacterium]
MKRFIAVIIILFLSQNIFAQSGWQWQNPAPQGNDLYDVQFVNANTGYAVGEKATVVKTTNGGLSWKVYQIPTSISFNRLSYLCAVDSLVVYVATGESKAFKTTDGGENWINLPDMPDINFLSNGRVFSFLDTNTGIMINNGQTYKTTNGGFSWVVISTLEGNPDLDDIYFTSNQEGYISTYENGPVYKIFKTTNQGLNWSICYQTNNFSRIKNIQFINSSKGYAFYEYSDMGGPHYINILKTTNQGSNWNLVSHSITSNSYNRVFFSDDGSGILMGVDIVPTFAKNNFYKTTNDGVNWSDAGIYGRATAINFPQPAIGYAVGFGGYIYKSTDFGNNWTCINSLIGDVFSFNTLSFPNNNTGYITGSEGIILKTSNSGENWSSSQIGHKNLTSSYFLNSNTGYIGADSNKMYKTTNGGNSWDTLATYTSANPITSIYFVNEHVGFFANSYSNAVSKTTNAGISWTLIPFTIIYGSMNSLQFTDSLTGFLYQYYYNPTGFPPQRYTYIYKTTNQGETWSLISSFFNNVQATGLKFINANTGYMNANKILKTTNGGVNWAEVLNTNDQGGIDVLDMNTVYTGSYKSTNAGLNWTLYNTKAQSISGIHYINQTTGIIICGNSGGILRTTDGGEIISSVYGITSNEITDNFSLHQNYPNPFNPSTVIRYQLSVAGFITLKVFDLLGKEVAALVNEKQNAGTYAVDFNSTEFNLPSGIYFYTLNAGEFKETKKMVLVK